MASVQKISEISKVEFSELCQKITPDLVFKNKYDKETDTTNFEIIFPDWLFQKYNSAISNKVVSVITPMITDILKEQTNKTPDEVKYIKTPNRGMPP